MTISVENSSPFTLLRAFSDRRHAEEFVQSGRLRLGNIRYYRTIEDEVRRDATEGELELRVPAPVVTVHLDGKTLQKRYETEAPGLLSFGSSYHNPVYLLCMSSLAVDEVHLRRLGQHVVCIADTNMLIDDVVQALGACSFGDREVFFVDLGPVAYNKGAIAPAPEGDDRIRMTFTQKPEGFASDREHRLAVGLSGPLEGAPDFICLQLARTRTYCSFA